ncbi:hypothetical protein ACI6PS_16055 [Flavobacterium sp. PLA-1-15]|uniref:hypothetical protein n=1 Tax=Flavobacterium sp. PLA-1-15 TaxID=3380533 RepID=UPI003B779D3E
MKKIFLLLVLAFTIGCDRDDNKTTNPIDQLPPATQTGAGTFGCLINGKPFVDNSGFFNCFYQFVEGEYYFGIQGEDNVSDIVLIGLGSNASQILVNNIISLNEREPQNFYGGVNLANLGGSIRTTNAEDGSIIFTKFDLNQNIVSATFEFTVVDPNTGSIYEITEGRFDAKFTQ